MSDVKDEFMKNFSVEADVDKKEKELKAHRVNVQYERLKDSQEKRDNLKQLSFGTISDERAEELAKENEEYFEDAKKSLGFICPAFDQRIPFHRKNLILIGADSGDGKSTAVANIVHYLVTTRNKVTGKTCRVLVITNEENITDFYNRITCLLKGIHYVDHELFTDEQKAMFSKYIKVLKNRVTIVDDTFNSTPDKIIMGATTTPEGIDMIFQKLINDKEFYDAVLIDYYQGVNESNMDLSMDEYKAQRKLTNVLEKWRKVYPAPIVLMCQVNRDDPESPSPMKYRIMGTKLIYTRATLAMEMVKHANELMTEWIIHKGRFAKLDQSIKTGYLNGKFVDKDDPEYLASKQDIARNRELKAELEFNKEIGIKVGGPGHGEMKKVEEKVNG